MHFPHDKISLYQRLQMYREPPKACTSQILGVAVRRFTGMLRMMMAEVRSEVMLWRRRKSLEERIIALLRFVDSATIWISWVYLLSRSVMTVQVTSKEIDCYLDDLKMNTSYVVRIAALNKYGVGEYLECDTFQTNLPFGPPSVTHPPTIDSITDQVSNVRLISIIIPH